MSIIVDVGMTVHQPVCSRVTASDAGKQIYGNARRACRDRLKPCAFWQRVMSLLVPACQVLTDIAPLIHHQSRMSVDHGRCLSGPRPSSLSQLYGSIISCGQGRHGCRKTRPCMPPPAMRSLLPSRLTPPLQCRIDADRYTCSSRVTRFASEPIATHHPRRAVAAELDMFTLQAVVGRGG